RRGPDQLAGIQCGSTRWDAGTGLDASPKTDSPCRQGKAGPPAKTGAVASPPPGPQRTNAARNLGWSRRVQTGRAGFAQPIDRSRLGQAYRNQEDRALCANVTTDYGPSTTPQDNVTTLLKR